MTYDLRDLTQGEAEATALALEDFFKDTLRPGVQRGQAWRVWAQLRRQTHGTIDVAPPAISGETLQP